MKVTQNNILPIREHKEILNEINKNKLEDVKSILKNELELTKIRGYSFKIPKPGTPVIILFSGGLDSITVCDILLKKYQLKVYPLFIRRGQIRMPIEEKSVDFFAKYFKKKYPNQFSLPKKINNFIPPLEFRFDITKYADHSFSKNKQWQGIPMYTSILAEYAVNYSVYLERKNNIKIRNIFFGIVKGDGLVLKYETLTFLRSITHHICTIMGDFKWQITSLPIEKNLGYFFDKEALINWCKYYNLPIHKSFSCLEPSFFHCGKCKYCKRRKKAFSDEKQKDKTIYLNEKQNFIYKILNKPIYSLEYLKFFIKIYYSFMKYFLKYYFGR